MGIKYKCQYCGKKFDSSKSTKLHERQCIDNKNRNKPVMVKCPLCNKKIKQKDFGKHLDDYHPDHVKGSGYKLLRICQYCKQSWETTLSGMHVHERFCKENPNREQRKGTKHTKKTKQRLSEIMKEIATENWQNNEYRALNSAIQYMAKHHDLAKDFDIYYAYDISKNLYKVGLTMDIVNRPDCFDNAIASSEYVSIRHFTNIKEAVLCEACITLNFYEDTKEYYTEKTLKRIKKFVKNYDYDKEKESDIAKRIFTKKYKKHKKKVKEPKVNPNLVTEQEWNERLNKIIKSKINLLEYGFITKLIDKTGLSKRIIYNTIEHFNLEVYKTKRNKDY